MEVAYTLTFFYPDDYSVCSILLLKRGLKTVAIDLDGTLLNDDKIVSAANKKAIRSLYEDGVRIVLASGRMTDRIRVYEVSSPHVSEDNATRS